ncbi:glycoside hydrolase [Massarina eburnea CBS 473.64]|uniref:non-reducing end alpha-L-arabinofuranosidase n=1 Tax=Massarina eburnea CBS 473.64 TaxID=1395130 RepID=A0A6A6RRG9_9PLEO|nr:glycoside hydrolase [Massarina eburnea CBS 473.64]
MTMRSLLLGSLALASVSAVDISVASSGGNTTSKIPFGLMHEDINNAGDGGIYAELIRNRAFQGSSRYPVSTSHWTPINGAALSIAKLSTPLSQALPSNLHVTPGNSSNSSSGTIGFANDGFWGFDVRKQEYKGSFYVFGAYEGKFTASLQSALTNETFGSVDIPSESSNSEWIQHNFTLVPTKDAPNSNNTFALTFSSSGLTSTALDFNLISLFPPTYKNRTNGLRPDIAEALVGLNPKFLRFPGGNALEGPDLKNPWRWNETIGPLKDRPGRPGTWGYQTSDGLGLVEYFEWCDDMELEPILAIHSGLALDGAYISELALTPWIQDALNELEFVLGPATTPYGRLRASLGHPTPWALKYVEIGNEDWLAGAPSAYDAYRNYRFPLFRSAIEAAYPDIQIIASPSVFDNMTIPVGVVGDYHPYREPDAFYNEFGKFDNLTTENLTLVGEFASVHTNGGAGWDADLHPFPWWIGSIGEAIFMIATTRASPTIIGATYAPILRNMNRWQWSSCILEFSASKTTLSTSWYVFNLIARTDITATLPTTPSGNTSSLFFVAGETADGARVFKAANYNTTDSVDTPVRVGFEGVEGGRKGTLTVLTGKEGPWGFNDPAVGNNVVVERVTDLVAGEGGVFEWVMPELSVAELVVGGEGKRRRRGVGYDAYSRICA